MSKLQRFAEIRQAWQIVVCQIDSATAAGIHNHTLMRDRHCKGNLTVHSLSDA